LVGKKHSPVQSMKSKQIFLLLKSLHPSERAEIAVHLEELLRSKKGTVYQLYAEISKLKRWKDEADAKLQKLFKHGNTYYKARVSLTEHLLVIIGKMRRKPDSTHNYDFAIQHALFKYVLGSFAKDVQKLLKDENYVDAARLLEKGERALRRQGIKEQPKELARLPMCSTVRGWVIQEWEIKNAVEEVRKAFKLPMEERKRIAGSILLRFEDLEPAKSKAQILHLGLMARAYLLAGMVELAGEYGIQSLTALWGEAKKYPQEVLDEFSFVLPLLIGLKKREMTTRFVMQLGRLKVKGTWQEEHRHKLEIENLVSMAVAFNNLSMAELARKLLQKPNSAIDLVPRSKYIYGIGLSYFMSGKANLANRIFSSDLLLLGKGDPEALWFIDCLQMLRFFVDHEDEMTLMLSRKLRNKEMVVASDYSIMVCDLVEDLSSSPLSERYTKAGEWLEKVYLVGEKPDNIRFQQYFDLALFLKAYTNQTTMADIARNSGSQSIQLAN